MKRLFAALAVVCGTLGCKVDLNGTCTKDSDCKAGLTCDSSVDPHVCLSACDPVCGTAQTCANAKCVSTGPVVEAVRVTDNPAPGLNGFYARSAANSIPVSVDVSPGFGGQIASVFLTVNGNRIDLTTSSTVGTVTTYNFTVPTLDAPVGTDGPLLFQVTATDASNNQTQVTPTAGLKIDDAGPVVRGVAVDATVSAPEATVSSVPWFRQSVGTDIDVKATIVDPGTGVDITTVKLMQGITRIDKGTVTRDPGTDNYHFKVARIGVPVGAVAEALVNFRAVASDVLGHAQVADSGSNISTGQLGIDGKAPDLSAFAITYPMDKFECDVDPTPASLVCGHDGSHFWRRGLGPAGAETTAVSFSPVESGSGLDPAGGTCTIAGDAAPCGTLSFAAGAFTFKPNFSSVPLSPTATTGGGTANVTVTARDLVGNDSSAATQAANVSRVRWVQKLAVRGVTTIRGSPVVTAVPAPQVIVGGTSASADAIVALKPSGAFFWSFGAGAAISPVSTNMLYDPTASSDPAHPSPVLYVAGSSTLFALHVDVLSTPAKVDKYCTGALGTAVGSPTIVGAGATASVVLADDGATKQVTAFSTSNMSAIGGACTTRDFARLAGGQAAAEVGPTTASGTTIYYGYNNSAATAGDLGIVSTTFSSGTGTFSGTTSHALGFAPTTNTGMAVVAIADALVLGNASAKTYHRVNASDFSTGNWTSTAFGATTNLVAPPTVVRGLVLGLSSSPSRVKAMSKADGTSPWSFPAATSLNAISQVATASDGMLYFSDSLNNELVALPPDGTSPAWTFTGFTGVTFAGPGTEPTIDANGILYFGADNGNVYAIITDIGNTAPVSGAGADWPRTGFDRCNSGNTSFVCQ